MLRSEFIDHPTVANKVDVRQKMYPFALCLSLSPLLPPISFSSSSSLHHHHLLLFLPLLFIVRMWWCKRWSIPMTPSLRSLLPRSVSTHNRPPRRASLSSSIRTLPSLTNLCALLPVLLSSFFIQSQINNHVRGQESTGWILFLSFDSPLPVLMISSSSSFSSLPAVPLTCLPNS